MAFNYSTFSTQVDKVLIKFGASATLTRKPAGTYDPNTSIATVSPVTDTVTAIVFPYPEKLIDGTMILRGDLQVFVSPLSVSMRPQPADKFTWFGVPYIVVSVKDYNPAGQTALYELQVRK